jgi:hypothetical protein
VRAANVDVLEGLSAGFADDSDQVYHGIDARQAPLDRVCLEDVSWMAGCRPDAWRPGVIRGRRKGASPASSSEPGFGRRSGPGTSRRSPPVRSRSPGRSKVRLPSISARCPAVTLSDTGGNGECAQCRRSERLRVGDGVVHDARRSGSSARTLPGAQPGRAGRHPAPNGIQPRRGSARRQRPVALARLGATALVNLYTGVLA